MTADEVDRKMNAAFDLLNEGDAKGALALGRELEEQRHSSGFEIQALALAELENVPEAIAVLERGVEKAPGVWLLWQLLGNNRSDEGCYEEAVAAYKRALECPHVDTLSVHYNIATVLTRQEKPAEALAHLDLAHVGSDDADRRLVLLVANQRIALLAQLDRHEDALREGRKLITRERVEGTLDELTAPVLGEYASALWTGMRDREGAQEAAWKAIQIEKHDRTAMWVLRELNTKASSDGCLYRLLLVGRWHQVLDEGDEHPGFFTTYKVVADSVDEALEFARSFEPADVRDSLKIDESEVIEARPGEPKGVYSTSGYSFFPGRDLEEEQPS
jgi:tetratricopeptide (TPR) repeat protein